MRVNDDYPIVNAAIQVSAGRANARSMLVPPFRFWQRGLEMRKQHVGLFVYGDFQIVKGTHPTVFAFRRACDPEESITILNFSGKKAEFSFPAGHEVDFWALGSYDAASLEKPKKGVIQLLPWEGLLGMMKGEADRGAPAPVSCGCGP